MLEHELSEENQKLKSLRVNRNETKAKVEDLEAKLTTDRQNIAERIEELKSDYIEYLNDQAAKRNEKQSIQQQLGQLSGKKKNRK